MIHKTPSTRRRRFQTQSTGKRVSLKLRDRCWLEALRDHGPLTGPYLHKFTEPYLGNSKASMRRLTDLVSETNTEHKGAYLQRPPAQKQTFNAMNNPLIYDLAPAGFKALNLLKSNLTRPTGPFPHQVMVAAVTASIELACLHRDDVQFIAGQTLLDRALANLGVDLEIVNPITERVERHRLVPDGLFALEYASGGQKQYRAFVLECDRGTEPITAKSFARKSYERSYFQYQTFIRERLFRDAYGLSCNLVVLNVMAQRKRGKSFMDLIEKHTSDCSYMLFQALPDFAANIVPKRPYMQLLERPWHAVGREPFYIDRP